MEKPERRMGDSRPRNWTRNRREFSSAANFRLLPRYFRSLLTTRLALRSEEFARNAKRCSVPPRMLDFEDAVSVPRSDPRATSNVVDFDEINPGNFVKGRAPRAEGSLRVNRTAARTRALRSRRVFIFIRVSIYGEEERVSGDRLRFVRRQR